MKRALPILCGTLILMALWASIGAPRQGRTTRGVLLTPVVRIAGHRTAVDWGGNCLDCHPVPVIGKARVAVSSASIHRTIQKTAYQHARASVARRDKTASAKPSGRSQSAAAPASSNSSSPP